MKIVLDSNVIVSALLSPGGLPAKILNLVLDGSVTIVYDNCVFSEYVEVLGREKFNINRELIHTVLDFIRNEGEYKIALPQNIAFDDEDDKMFYELYKSGGTIDYLITGNKKHFPNEDGIVSPREYIEAMRRDARRA